MTGRESAFPFQQKTVWSDKKWSDGSCLESMAVQQGLSKRELFAAMAMTAAYMYGSDNGSGRVSAEDVKNFARSCVAYADALIAELSKEPDEVRSEIQISDLKHSDTCWCNNDGKGGER